MASRLNREVNETPRRPPATTVEGRENQLISAAMDLVEQQIAEGTVSATVLANVIKLGTTRERLEQRKLSLEAHLLEARAEELASQARTEELYEEAIKAMRSYAGSTDPLQDMLDAEIDY